MVRRTHAWLGMEDFMNWVSSELGTVRIIGSCALSLAHAGLGRAAATILPGRYNSWDVAAGIIIATEGGCRLFDANGSTIGLPANGASNLDPWCSPGKDELRTVFGSELPSTAQYASKFH